MPVLDDAHAVVIGIAGYPNIGKLPDVVLKDAQDIRGILVDPDMCAYPPANVQLLLDDQAMRGKIRTSLADLAARTTPESTVFIYISSHGASIKSGPLAGAYLLPYDTVNDSAEALAGSSISGEEMTQSLAAIPAHKMVVVLDCCHAGGIGALKDAMAPEIKTGLPAEYFATLREGTGRVILSSSLSTESSQVLPNDENSLFTRFLLEGLRGEAPGPGGVIRILDLFSYVQPKVAAAARQHPLLEAEVQENFPIALYPRLKAPTEVPAQAPADEFAYDAFISYQDREPDKAWVRKTLLPALVARGIKVCIDYRDFRLGKAKIEEMERAVTTSRYTLAVLSPSYFSDSFNEFEVVMAQHLGGEESSTRLITLLRENTRPPLNLRILQALDMTDPDPDEFAAAVDRLVYQLRQPPGQP